MNSYNEVRQTLDPVVGVPFRELAPECCSNDATWRGPPRTEALRSSSPREGYRYSPERMACASLSAEMASRPRPSWLYAYASISRLEAR